MKQILDYHTPQILVEQLNVEQGFAASAGGTGGASEASFGDEKFLYE